MINDPFICVLSGDFICLNTSFVFVLEWWSAADPGVVKTNIMREIPSSLSWLAFFVLKLLGLLQSPEVGISSVLDAVHAPPVSLPCSLSYLLFCDMYQLALNLLVHFFDLISCLVNAYNILVEAEAQNSLELAFSMKLG